MNVTYINEWITELYKDWINDFFPYQQAWIISGQSEATYSWVTVNYLSGNLVEVFIQW